jgi:hypothetical protein
MDGLNRLDWGRENTRFGIEIRSSVRFTYRSLILMPRTCHLLWITSGSVGLP